jgi:hypothetical protein
MWRGWEIISRCKKSEIGIMMTVDDYWEGKMMACVVDC